MSASSGLPVSIGIVGMGAMGKGLFYQALITPEVQCVVVCDRDVDRCRRALDHFAIPHQMAETPSGLHDIIASGRVAVCAEGAWVAECEAVDVFVEATSALVSAAAHTLTALEHGKHVVLMNSEIDLMFGPLFARVARRNGVVCTSCDGDQYGVLKHLIDQTRRWGFDLVAAGNIKGFLDRGANPTSIVPEADKRRLDYRMCTSYTDGSKLNIEMAILANAYGLSVRSPGMAGPSATHVSEVTRLFEFDRLWADRRPFVEYILGAEPGGGVFVVGYCEHPYQRDMLAYYKMGPGPYYVFYRPYHLCHIEAMDSVLAAARGETLISPTFGMKTNVFAYAKRDLSAGEALDGLGGYTCYGKIEELAADAQSPGVPICLADGMVLTAAVPKDRKVLRKDVTFPTDRVDFKWYIEALASTPHTSQAR